MPFDYPTIPNGFQCEVMENNAKAGLDLKMLAVFVATLDARHALNEGFWFYSFTSFCWQRSAPALSPDLVKEHLIHGDQRERLKQAWLVHGLKAEGTTTREGQLTVSVDMTSDTG